MTRCLLIFILAFGLRAEDYCFGFLNASPERKSISEEEGNAIQEGHMEHMRKMNAEGHLLAAGPMMTQGGPRGIVIYRCASLEEARQWTSLDPAVINNRLTLDVYRWRGPDNLGEPLGSKLKKYPKKKIDMVQLPLIVLRKTDKWTGMPPAEIMAEHAGRVQELMKEGKMRMSGPWIDETGQVGNIPGSICVYVISAMALDDAKKIAEGDPMVREGYARVEPHMWFVADEAIPKPAAQAANSGLR